MTAPSSMALSLEASYRTKLMMLQRDMVEFSRLKGGNEELLYDAFIALMGEGSAAPRRTRSWAKPEWCRGQCPGCTRFLRLLCVPTLDVMICVYCSTACFVCISPESFASSGVLQCGSASDGSFPHLAGGDGDFNGAGDAAEFDPDDLGGDEDGAAAGTSSRSGAYGNYSSFGDKKASYASAASSHALTPSPTTTPCPRQLGPRAPLRLRREGALSAAAGPCVWGRPQPRERSCDGLTALVGCLPFVAVPVPQELLVPPVRPAVATAAPARRPDIHVTSPDCIRLASAAGTPEGEASTKARRRAATWDILLTTAIMRTTSLSSR